MPSSTELKSWILKGISFGAYFTVGLFGLLLIGVILYYLTPYIKTILDKETLIENWEEEFARAKQEEIYKVEKLKEEAQKKLQEVQKREQELRQQITHYQHLSHQLKRKEVELEIEFQQKRESYLQELSGLQKKNRELQARVKRLKEQLKSCREKLKKRGLA
jgi:chromosome segregation ATPase